MKLYGAENVINEWNMVAGYFDILYKMFLHYYEARLTPGFGDDIETLQLVFDHVLCYFENSKRLPKQLGLTNGITVTAYFDSQFNKINQMSSQVVLYKKGDYSPAELEKMTEIKKILRDIHRDLMRGCFILGMLSMNRKYNTKADFTADLGAQYDPNVDY